MAPVCLVRVVLCTPCVILHSPAPEDARGPYSHPHKTHGAQDTRGAYKQPHKTHGVHTSSPCYEAQGL